MAFPTLQAAILEELLLTMTKIRYAERECSVYLRGYYAPLIMLPVASSTIILFDHGMSAVPGSDTTYPDTSSLLQ